MKYQAMINGLPVKAEYPENSIEEIFLPLLRRLTDLQKKRDRRILVLLAAPPAAGKSTLSSFLEQLSRERAEAGDAIRPVTAIGMDGFHHYQDYLLAHTAERNGKTVTMVDIKGAPITFDLELLTDRIAHVAAGEECGWPIYDRLKHNPTEDALKVTGDIILLEGNYLLLDLEGWKNLRDYCDYTIRIIAEEKDLRQRLVDRKTASGTPLAEAEEFVDQSDLANARVCLENTTTADLTLVMDSDGVYHTEDDISKKRIKRNYHSVWFGDIQVRMNRGAVHVHNQEEMKAYVKRAKHPFNDVAVFTRTQYEEVLKLPLNITERSLTFELWGHYVIQEIALFLQRIGFRKVPGAKQFLNRVIRSTEVIDSGEWKEDNNRWLWDFCTCSFKH